MKCPDPERIAAHAEGRLEASEEELLLEHCAACDACRRELGLALLLGKEAEGPERGLDRAAKSRVQKALGRALDRERTPRLLRAPLRPAPAAPGWVAAAALVAFVVGIVTLARMREEAPRSAARRDEGAGARIVAPPQAGRPAESSDSPPAPAAGPQEPASLPPEPLRPVPPSRPLPQELRPEPEEPGAPREPLPPQVPNPEAPRAPSRPSHTQVARALTEIQLSDFTGLVQVRRKGQKEKERLAGVARLGEQDVLFAEKPASFRVDGRDPVVLGENTSVSFAYAAQEQAPYLQIRSGEAMVDSTGPTRWIVGDGRVSVVLKQARALFATAPGADRLSIMALSEPLYVQPDGGELWSIRPGEELQVGKSRADLGRSDPEALKRKSSAFDQGRPRQRTVFYTSCDPIDARREHFFVQEGSYFAERNKNEALVGYEGKDKVAAVSISPNPRVAWREGLVLRFRFMTNTKELVASLRVDERRYTIHRGIPVDKRSLNQWIWAEVPVALGGSPSSPGLSFRRDDGQNRLEIVWGQDKFDVVRFSARHQDLVGESRAYVLVDDIQFVEREKD